MKYATVKVPTITMDELTKLQNEYMFFDKNVEDNRTEEEKGSNGLLS